MSGEGAAPGRREEWPAWDGLPVADLEWLREHYPATYARWLAGEAISIHGGPLISPPAPGEITGWPWYDEASSISPEAWEAVRAHGERSTMESAFSLQPGAVNRAYQGIPVQGTGKISTLWHVAWGRSVKIPTTRLGRAWARLRGMLGRVGDAWAVLRGDAYAERWEDGEY